MRERTIIPSIIAKNQEELEFILEKVNNHVPTLQLDVMDGKFVPTQSLDFDFDLPLEKYEWEAHLMIKDPLSWINYHGDKMDTIIVHFEPLLDPPKIIELVKSKQKKVAFGLIPDTSIHEIKPYLDELDQVLIMTVRPGYYGSSFLTETLKKIKNLRQLKPQMDIEVDGGIKPDTIELVSRAGANLYVCGSYLIHSPNFEERLTLLKSKINLERINK